MKSKNRLILSSLITVAFASQLHAADGTWNSTTSNSWNSATSPPWAGSTIADGSGFTANFNAVNNPVAGITVTLGADRTIGNLIFGDTVTTTGGDWTVTGPNTLTLAGGTPTITVNSLAAGKIAIINSDLAGTVGFTKTGSGTLALSGAAKAITGGLTVNQGTLRLDLGTATTGVVDSTNALTLGGGTLNVQGNNTAITSSQTLGNLTLNGGLSAISLNPNGGTGTTLTLGNTWTKNAGGTLRIDLSSTAGGTMTVTSSPTLTNGILGYAVVKDGAVHSTGTGFATVSGGNVVRYTGATSISGTETVYTDSATTNYKTSAGVNFGGTETSQTINSLEVSGGNVRSSGSLTQLVLASGGLLFTNTVLLNDSTNSITITSSTGELNIYNANNNSPGTNYDTRVDYIFADNAGSPVSLVKSGPGVLTLYSAQNYSGDTVLNEGTLNMTAAILYGAGKGNLVVNGGTYNYGGTALGTRYINGLTNTSVTGGAVTGGGGFLDLGNGDATASFSGVISTGSIIKSGTGTQTFSGANTYTGSTTINGGKLKIANALGIGVQSTSLVLNNVYGVTVTPSGAGITSAALDLNSTLTNKFVISLNGTATPGNTASLINSAAATTAVLAGGTVGAVPFTNAGTGFNIASATVSPLTLTGGGGSGATAKVILASTAGTFTASGGTGWVTGNTLTVSGGGSTTSAVYTVTATDGAITGLTQTQAGIGFTSLSVTFTGAKGAAAPVFAGVDATFGSVDGTFIVSSTQITAAGTGYTSSPSVSSSDGTGFTATTVITGVNLAGAQNQMGGDGNLTINPPVTGAGGFTKIGAGTLTLSNVNSYTGDTTVSAGTLSLGDGTANTALANASTVTIAAGAVMNLNFSSGIPNADTVNALYLGTPAVQVPAGTYNSSTPIYGGYFTGLGSLEVATGPSGYTSWADDNAPGEAIGEDHDDDGVSNGVEYFMGLSGNGFTANPSPNASNVISWPKGALYTGAYGTDYAIQISSDLGITDDWTDVPVGNVTIDGDSVDYDLDTAVAGSKKFARLRVTGP